MRTRSWLMIGAALLLVAGDAAKPVWTSDLSKMKAPDAPVSGKIQGADFTVDAVKFDPIVSTLSFRQGKNFFPDAELTLYLFLKNGESLEEKKFEMAVDTPITVGLPHVHTKRMFPNEKVPKALSHSTKIALKLEMGKAKEGKIPGTIYVCLPDDDKSFVAGKFSVEAK